MKQPRNRSLARRLLRGTLILCIVVAAGPEIAIGLELIAMVDLLGAELFLTLVFGGIIWRARAIAAWLNATFERLDPFFFVPSRGQVATCPGILVHAVPFLVTACVAGYLSAPLLADGSS